MRGKLSPWGPIAFFLAALGLLLASLVGVRVLTLALSALGLAVALVGLPVSWKGRAGRDWAWLALGAGVSAAVLAVAWFVPGLLNRFWVLDVPVPQRDPNLREVVSREAARGAGRPLTDSESVSAEKEAIRQDELLIRLHTVTAGLLPEKEQTPYLLVNLRLTQLQIVRQNAFRGFRGDGQLPVLTDSSGRAYPFLGHRPRKQFATAFDPDLVDEILIFPVPPARALPLTLELPAAAWGRLGVCRFRIEQVAPEPRPDTVKLIAAWKKTLRTPPAESPDASLGRAFFGKNCQECHTVFGFGGKIGPDLNASLATAAKESKGSPYALADFVLGNVLDPSAVIAKGFQASVVVTTDGRIFTGIVKDLKADPLTLATAQKPVVLAQNEIEKIVETKESLMPNDLLKDATEHEVRSLVAYLLGRQQVPIRAVPDNALAFFTGKDFHYWSGAAAGWTFADEGFVAPAPRAGVPAQLTSELLLTTDFHLTLHVRAPRGVRGAVLIRNGETLDGAPAGPRVEITAGGRIAILGKDKRGPLQPEGQGAGNLVPADAWNKLEIIVTGKHLQVRLNGKDDIAVANAAIPGRSVLALEGPAGAGQQVRFRNLDLRLPPTRNDLRKPLP